ncbi:MAG: UvrD-helicase domain-containing protein [Acholeplasmatales bacterium]|nr:UvrD-helicase domain-containing protein [Acholeplasmatales bacterium]
MDLFKNLNENQIKAVKQTFGPVIVVAGAGSGKTRVLTHRLCYLVEQGVDPSNILAVTFTNKAAKEMKDRVDTMLGTNNTSTIMTFHSLCARILRKEADLLGYKRDFEIYDDEESNKVLKKVFEDLQFNNTDYKIREFRSLISAIKNGKSFMLEPRKQKDFNLCYEKYNEKLKFENAMDFDDLLLNVVHLFNNNIDVLDYYQRKFIYIMIDEFQDTNTIQYELVELLGSRFKNVFVVGDGDQSIYSFRNANVGNIKEFIRTFKPVQIILDVNYRSTSNILNAANSLIAKNHDRIKKDLKAVKDSGELVELKECDTVQSEMLYIKNKILALRNNGYNYSEMAVFYRINALSRNIEDMMLKFGIPYKIFGGMSFFSRKEIKDIIAYLKLVINMENLWAFKRVVNEPKRGIGNMTIDKIDQMVNEGYSLKQAINTLNNKKVFDFVNLINELKLEFSKATLVDYIDILVKKLNLEEYYKDEPERLENIYELKSVLEEADEAYEGTDFEKLEELMLYLALRTDEEMKIEGNEYVSLMSFHQAKGLEFPIVFMTAMEEGIFPSNQSIYNPADLEEERRIAYVGITRAKEKLFLSYARSRMLYGQTERQMPSRFIKEIDPKYIDNPSNRWSSFKSMETKKEEKKLYTQADYSNDSYALGEKVNHKLFGDGVIVGINDNILSIAFKEGIKKVVKNHPTLSKIEK